MTASGVDRPASAAEARALGEQLQAEPIKRANLAVRLLEAVDAGADEATCRAAIQGLLLFFIAACDAGQLRGVGGRGVGPSAASASAASAAAAAADDASAAQAPSAKRARTAAASADAAPSAAASAVYGGWIARQYTAYVDRLFALVFKGAAPGLQVAAVGALFEAARHEEGAARLGGALAARVVSALCRARRAEPAAMSLLMQRYLPHADISYYAMRAASKMAARLGSAASAADDEEEEDDDDEAGDGGDGEQDNNSNSDKSNDDAPAADQLRNLFDVLCRLPAMPPSAAARAADASAISKKTPGALLAGGGGGGGNGGGEVPPTSWCGALEAGLATAAADSGASSKARRRKQQQQQLQQQRQQARAGAGGGLSAAAATTATPPTTMAVSWACGRSRRRAFAAAWLAFLGCTLPPDLLRKALVRAQQRVLPALPDPGRLADFYSSALDAGGLDGMLALQGLFVLVTRHGLEYPRFYPRLYGLLAGTSLASLPPAQRARFLRLADAFLASPAVPAYSAAAFAKRFARLALRAADPGLALVCLAFVHNLVRRHPSCMVLLHRPLADGVAVDEGAGAAAGQEDGGARKKRRGDGNSKAKGGSSSSSGGGGGSLARWDVYDEAAADPADSRAVDSSLWEAAALRRHHCPHVAALAHKVAGKDLSDRKGTAEMDVAGLLEASAGTLAEEDFGRRLKAAPATAARPDAETAALTLFGRSRGGGEDGEAGSGGAFFEGWELPAV